MLLSATFQWTDSLLLDSVPANAIGKLTDVVLGDNIISASAAADIATSASGATGNRYDPAVFDYSADPSNLFERRRLWHPRLLGLQLRYSGGHVHRERRVQPVSSPSTYSCCPRTPAF
jgi:hypothetical protein